MAWTEADLTTIDTAILNAAQGKSVTFGGRSWTSQDLSDLLTLRASIVLEISVLSGGSTRLAVTRKGT